MQTQEIESSEEAQHALGRRIDTGKGNEREQLRITYLIITPGERLADKQCPNDRHDHRQGCGPDIDQKADLDERLEGLHVVALEMCDAIADDRLIELEAGQLYDDLH